MAEYKVLGASDRNLKAIEMALSMGGGKSINGEIIPDFHYKDYEEEIVKDETTFPFKLNVIEISGQQYLSIDKGLVYCLPGNQFFAIFYNKIDEGEGHDVIPLSGIDIDYDCKDIAVVLEMSIDHWDGYDQSIFFTRRSGELPFSNCDRYFILGFLERDQGKFKVYSQMISNDLYINFPEEASFLIKSRKLTYHDFEFVSGFSLSDYEIYINGGFVYFGTGNLNVPSLSFNLSGTATYDVYCNWKEVTPEYLSGELQLQNLSSNEVNSVKIGSIRVQEYSGSVSIDIGQNQLGDLGIPTKNAYKVRYDSYDESPGFLENKFVGDSNIQIGSQNSKVYIGIAPGVLRELASLQGTGYIYFNNGQLSLRTPSNNN